MATTTTTNITLVKPDYSEAADVQVLNGNADKIDAAFGVAYNAFGIVVNGNKAALSAATGQFVVLKNSTISGRADGLYTAAKPIPANTAINNTYLTAVASGGLNALFSAITALQSAIGFVANGNKTTAAVGVDQFVLLKNSTISGCADGLYLAAKVIPANTAIDSTYLTAVTIGGLNTATNRLRMKKTISVTSDENSTIDLELTDEYTVTSVRAYNNQNIVCMPYMMSNGAWRARIIHANTGQPLASGARPFIVTYMRAQ